MSVSPAKATLRAEALAARDRTDPALQATFAERLARVGPSLIRTERNPFADPVVAAYWPIRGEADPMRLVDVLGKAGTSTALPVVVGHAQPLLFRAWRTGDPTVAGPWGIGHPVDTAPVVEPDVLFVPLAAFDRRGARLGYGAGYYDATLAVLRSRKSVRAIGIAFASQEVLFLPTEPHDQPLDLVVTEREIILCDDG